MIGRTGQVARELQRRKPGARFLDRQAADLSRPDLLADVIANQAPDVVINAAGWTDVDGAEEHEAAAMIVNATAPGVMAEACARRDIPFLHISTDYVFDGSGQTAWRESDQTHPLGSYGRTKLEGENQVQAAGGRHAILRTAWVFSAHGRNFVKTMLRLSETRDSLAIVDDQIGGPTWAGDIAQALLVMANALHRGDPARGVFHFAGAPATSWAGFGSEIFTMAGRDVAVSAIPTADYPTPAVRPLNSRLDCRRITESFGIAVPDWRVGLRAVLKELEDADAA